MLCPWVRDHNTHWLEGWVEHRGTLDVVANRWISCPCQESFPGHLAHNFSLYTNWNTQLLKYVNVSLKFADTNSGIAWKHTWLVTLFQKQYALQMLTLLPHTWPFSAGCIYSTMVYPTGQDHRGLQKGAACAQLNLHHRWKICILQPSSSFRGSHEGPVFGLSSSRHAVLKLVTLGNSGKSYELYLRQPHFFFLFHL
jgi:hypothetical protein